MRSYTYIYICACIHACMNLCVYVIVRLTQHSAFKTPSQDKPLTEMLAKSECLHTLMFSPALFANLCVASRGRALHDRPAPRTPTGAHLHEALPTEAAASRLPALHSPARTVRSTGRT